MTHGKTTPSEYETAYCREACFCNSSGTHILSHGRHFAIKIQIAYGTFCLPFRSYHGDGSGEGFLVMHHGQDHIDTEKVAGFIRNDALQEGDKMWLTPLEPFIQREAQLLNSLSAAPRDVY